MSKVEKRHLFRWLLLSVFCLTAAFMFFSGSKAYAAGGLTISGAQEGDYTYTGGVLKLLKPGDYTIGMAEGVTQTSDRIVITVAKATASTPYNLTFDKLNIKNSSYSCFEITVGDTAEEYHHAVNITTVGESTLSTEGGITIAPFTSNKPDWADYTFSGSGKLSAISDSATYATKEIALQGYSVTLNSGELSVTNGSIHGREGVYINDGHLTVTNTVARTASSKVACAVSTYGLFRMTKGKADLSGFKRGIQIDDVATPLREDKKEGVEILGGDLNITVTGNDGNAYKYYGIYLNPGAKDTKFIRFATPGKITINAPNGIFKTNSASGYVPGSADLYFDDGETEIICKKNTVITTPRYWAISNLIPHFDSDYLHQSYAGESGSSSRVKKLDYGRYPNGIFAAGSAEAPCTTSIDEHYDYVLITPAYPISYDYDGGSLDEGVTNPDKYTRVDLPIVLNNPTKEDATFLGWTGTGLEEMTETVTIPEGSTGERAYTAHWDEHNATITYVAGTGGKVNPTEEIVNRKEGQAQGSTATPDSGYRLKNWTDEQGKVVGTYAKYVPEKVDGAYVTATYTANFEKAPAPTPKEISGMLLARVKPAGSKKLKLDWTKINGADGYDIFMANCGHSVKDKKVKTINGNRTFKWTKAGLKKKTAYKLYVKAWVMKNGKKNYVQTSQIVHAFTSGGNKKYTNAKSVTLRKTKVNVKKGKAVKIKANVIKLKKSKKLMNKSHAPKLRYLSSDKKIATVTKGGKIKAVGKGNCMVYVYAHNGVRKAVKVTVK